MDNKDDIKYLLHFTTVDSLMKILVTDEFRFSNVLYMNDINESIPIHKRYYNDSKRYMFNNELVEDEIKLRSKTFLGCFNIFENEGDIRNKPSMWGHYGDRGEGVCLKINKDILDSIVENVNNDDDLMKPSYNGHIRKFRINYKSNEEIEQDNNIYIKSIERKKYVAPMPDVYWAKRMFSIKSKDWEIENEFRYLFYFWDNEQKYFYLDDFKKCIDSIYIGDKHDRDSLKLLLKIKEKLAGDIRFYIRNGYLQEKIFDKEYYYTYING
ncbi:DUF2971 domain-containing protein [Clostridium sardiniense]|uniref:DUF2971 domain-containing protein n=1 Tax=Clostridium sardiniense TaxID=29369 RepID=UPI001959ED28|nr:DUF2971 domain-containing protein [Clostridium sardiniense]MBM7835637.1 hypothetical protein [Clostridium sardiniense]